MEGKRNIFFLILICHAVFLFGTTNSTLQLLKLLEKGFFANAILRAVLAPKCNPSMRTYPGINDLVSFSTCFQPTPWINGSRRHPDQDLRANQVFIKYGYNLITYNNLTTEDGYILTVHRIVGSSRSKPARSGKPSVLLFHGLGTASDEWVLQSDEKKNLPMKLVNEGYDVWLANARGTDLSRRHVSLDSFWDLKYWDFSFHEMGVYDLPAIIDLMINETGNAKVFFVGHNYAANVYAAALSEKPELNDKIAASVLLGPAIFTGHANTPLRPFFRAATDLDPFLQGQVNAAVRGSLTFGNWMMNSILARFCTPTAIKCGVCGNLMFFLYGYDAPQINFRDIPNMMSKVPNTISFKSAIHMGQGIKACDFRKYDYGRRRNMKVYGKEQAPQYNLTNLRAPVHIYFGSGDNLATVEDIVMTRYALPQETLKEIYRVPWKLFNNADFTIAKDAESLVYNRILDTFKEYTTKYSLKKKFTIGKETKGKIEITNGKKINEVETSNRIVAHNIVAKTTGKPSLSVHIYNKNNETQTTEKVILNL